MIGEIAGDNAGVHRVGDDPVRSHSLRELTGKEDVTELGHAIGFARLLVANLLVIVPLQAGASLMPVGGNAEDAHGARFVARGSAEQRHQPVGQ